ncbi:hypothetical protein DFJ73DRAFT_116098 [Zopfochytrium polystomum]|nr:hypothetical protein DFJ73DRAFT_116098 [Zopfochytrium polystomum]
MTRRSNPNTLSSSSPSSSSSLYSATSRPATTPPAAALIIPTTSSISSSTSSSSSSAPRILPHHRQHHNLRHHHNHHHHHQHQHQPERKERSVEELLRESRRAAALRAAAVRAKEEALLLPVHGSSSTVVVAGALPSPFVALELHRVAEQRAHRLINVIGSVAGPLPPRGWIDAPTRPIQVQVHFKDPPTRVAGVQSRHSLLNYASRTIAKNLGDRLSPLRIAQLPFYLKQTVMSARAALSMAGETIRLSSTLCTAFADPQLRVCDLSHSAITVADFEASFLPRPTKSLSRLGPHAPLVDDWEQLDGVVEGPEDDPGGPGCPAIHTLRVAFTDLKQPTRFAHLLCERLPLLAALDISGCFDIFTGPTVLSILSRGLPNLALLNISYCSWATQAVLEALPWNGEFFRGLLVMQVHGCPVEWGPLCRFMVKVRPALKLVFEAEDVALDDLALECEDGALDDERGSTVL